MLERPGRGPTVQYDYRKSHDIKPIIEVLEDARTKGATVGV